jgi:glucose/mannose transport system substrate-binding protein
MTAYTEVRATLISTLILIFCAGCGGAVSPAAQASHDLDVYYVHTDKIEGQALDTVVEILRQRDPDIHLVEQQLGVEDGWASLSERFKTHTPPDSFHTLLGDDTATWVGEETLASLDDISAAEGWPNVFPKEVLASARTNGSLYTVPLEIQRNNTLFFNKKVLSEKGLSPPASIADVLDVARVLAGPGKYPMAMTSNGWAVASMLFDSLFLAEAGPDVYRAYLTGQLVPDAPEMRAALADLAELADYANPEVTALTWDFAVDGFCRGEAAMLMMPDFVKSQLASSGCLDESRIGYAPLEPVGTPTFVFFGLGYSLVKEAKHPANGQEFLRTVGSREGQEAFNLIERGIPARLDARVSGLDFVTAAGAADYRAQQETLLPGYDDLTPQAFQQPVRAGLGDFLVASSTAYKNVDAVLELLRSNYALLKR